MKRRRAFLVVMLALAGCHDRESQATSSVSGGESTGSDKPGSGSSAKAEDSPHKQELLALYDLETKQRAAIDFATLPPSDATLGSDPYRIVRAGTQRFGLLRGESMVVALGDDGREVARVAAPRAPSGIAAAPDGSVLVVGEDAREIARYRFSNGTLERAQTIAIDALGMRDIAVAPDGKTAYVVEERDGRLLALALDSSAAQVTAHPKEITRCHGPVQVAATAKHVVINCLLDHDLVTRNLVKDVEGDIKIHHDGPFWSLALLESPFGLLIAAGGVENHPLLREDGGFGYVDSFVYLYGIEPVRKLADINTSELGVVTPKWIAIDRTAERGTTVTVSGYATPKLLTLTWPGDAYDAAPKTTSVELPPGTTAGAVDGELQLFANPLLDAWVVRKDGALSIVPVGKPRDVESRIGELLFFTNLMAPWNGTDGKLSRFTCETCHHEGYVDGRTHFTGRGTVHATTRPLLGLFNNAPYFSRALDQSMTQMVHSEFKVANRHNGRDPWFALTKADLPWIANVPGLPDKLSPELLRRSFMAFLRDFTHRTNPAVVGRDKLTDLERGGAAVFRDRCASCHAARLVADDDKTAVAFERWEALVLSAAGPIVWNDAEYEKTGVLPYVHDRGTRVPSLRRLYKKWPYFTNGSAKSLGDVLDRYGYAAKAQFHDGAPADATKLTADEKKQLLAFLSLL